MGMSTTVLLSGTVKESSSEADGWSCCGTGTATDRMRDLFASKSLKSWSFQQ